ncbi:type I restriction enzyme R subunit [Hydrogenispora ethanolica]|uniref:Type I restriction enzyme R subunit n=1 Tax=Hydrogenispora ethanolica TaxID=1082276 RepID=A0A4R1SA90_HYDET|nr:DEAD/DEAH box helicase family protein [Hydrogenispora ethanolica]TCL76423.1 type I restriction enzyme R subunit [Hydrogenispora ethanolica]
MPSNFSFLQKTNQFDSFSEACLEAEKTIASSASATAILCRRALELAVRWVYSSDGYLKVPYQDNLSSLIHNRSFQDVLEPKLFPLIRYIVTLGNHAAHTNQGIRRGDGVVALHNLHQFVSWVSYCYSTAHVDSEFHEEWLPAGTEQKVSQKDLEELYNRLGATDKELKDVVAENEKLREEIRKIREAKDTPFKVDEISEFETRKHYIDLDLREAGWRFGEDCIEEYPVLGMPSGSGQGSVDYVLFGNDGKPLGVVEAKRTSKDPKVGQHQAKLYANCLESKFGQRPVIFYSNGFETYLWDDTRYPERRVSGFYSKDELQLLVNRRKSRIPLENIKINETITNRYYQKEAIKAICDSLEDGDRKALLVMATGSGKTRVAASLVDLLSRHEWVKNVLFLADRTALVRQAKNAFNNFLPSMSLCNLMDNKDNPESRIVFSTYPTMMNAIDETKAKNGQRLFTVGHFDMIIIDESHRSIYQKYQAIFDYFDAMLVGLTATPKADIDKNTYHLFDLENNVPTYAYELKTAVEDRFLVYFQKIETKLKFLSDGIHYDDLSEAEKEQFEETFDDDVPEDISSEALNSWLFNDDTIEKVLTILMQKGIKVEGGDKFGKTIIFAKNHKHAERIVERFNALYPEYGGHFARVIDNYVTYAQSLLDDFSDPNKLPQIAVSVDMLDTGIDIPEIVNLVFFKKVFSKAKFWQMIGRGTRLCEGLFGVGLNKKEFYIFDFCGNFEFFRVNEHGREAKISPSITEILFGIKVDMVKELQQLEYQQECYTAYRNQLIEELTKTINQLNRRNFVVKQHLLYVDKYSSKDAWTALGILDAANLKAHIAPLIKPEDDDELAKRFDEIMFVIELGHLMGKSANMQKESVVRTAFELSKLGTIPQILAKKETIAKIKTDDFWDNADIFAYENVREDLRELIKFIERKKQDIYYTDFTDEILALSESPGEFTVADLNDYQKKVNQYLREHQDNVAIYKLKNNKPLTKQDFMTLEQILWGELGTKEEYQKEFGDTPLSILVREMIGLDRQAANEAFGEFLTNENLNSRQIRFVKNIVDYIVKNGHMLDKTILQEEPFKTVGSIVELFPMETALGIVAIIDQINKNAIDFVGA